MHYRNERDYHWNPGGNGTAMAWIFGLIFGGFFLFWPLFLHSVVTRVTVQVIWLAGIIWLVALARRNRAPQGDWCPGHNMPRADCPHSKG